MSFLPRVSLIKYCKLLTEACFSETLLAGAAVIGKDLGLRTAKQDPEKKKYFRLGVEKLKPLFTEFPL